VTEPPSSSSSSSPSSAAWRVVADGRLVQGAPPVGVLFVEGTLQRGRFVARGDVQGEGPLGVVDGEPGWLELATGRFVSATSATAPTPPWVEGVMTASGFVPGSRVVVYGP